VAATRQAAPTGVATGIGSLPGDDIDAALAMVFDAVPDLPHLPELPARGPGSDLVGRTATNLADLPVDLQPSGWRLTGRPGLDARRGRDRLERDLDALIPVAGPGYDGRLKLQLAGPWTLAATIELPRGDRALADAGAVRDLASSLAETVRRHLDEARKRVPGARLVLQLDEPGLPAVLTGRVPTQSGFGRIRVVEEMDARAVLQEVVSAAGDVPVVVHCCDPAVPLRLLRDAGVAGVSVDVSGGHRLDMNAAGELSEAGVALWLGAVPALLPGRTVTPRAVADPVRQWWYELGFEADRLPTSVALTPACGLAGASPEWAAAAYRLLQSATQVLVEAPEGISG
jgi:methionine synthase II (cobalamin-independent)